MIVYAVMRHVRVEDGYIEEYPVELFEDPDDAGECLAAFQLEAEADTAEFGCDQAMYSMEALVVHEKKKGVNI